MQPPARVPMDLVEQEQNCMTTTTGNERAGGTAQQKGVIADAVEEVLNIGEADIEATPDVGATVDKAYILVMARNKSTVKSLLDIDHVVGTETTDLLQAKAAL